MDTQIANLSLHPMSIAMSLYHYLNSAQITFIYYAQLHY